MLKPALQMDLCRLRAPHLLLGPLGTRHLVVNKSDRALSSSSRLVFMGIIVNEYRQRRYAEALAALERSNKQDYWVMHFLAAITQAQTGNRSAAQPHSSGRSRHGQKFAQKFSKAAPQKWFFKPAGLIDHMMEGVRSAGWFALSERTKLRHVTR